MIIDNKRVLIIGDSTALKREELDYSHTYAYLLRKNYNSFFDILNNSKKGLTSNDILLNKNDLFGCGLNSDYIILQYGLVDSFPRPIPYNDKSEYIYKGLTYIGLSIESFLLKTKLYYKLSNFFNFKKVNIKKFKLNSSLIIEELLKNNTKKIFLIAIPLLSTKMRKKIPILENEIKKYNDIFLEISMKNTNIIYIDTENMCDEDYLMDGQHYNTNGMMKIYLKLAEHIEKELYLC